MKLTKGMRIGILTSGGDCPGLNAAIRGVGKTAIVEYGMDVVGISSGFQGLIEKEYVELKEKDLSGILTLGGTILGTSREKPFKKGTSDEGDKVKKIQKNYKDLKLDALVCIGGNGTQKTAYKLSKQGLNIIGLPKTIDNDVWGTDKTFGFDSAVNIATEAIDRLHSTANSHKRIMVIEVMGHHAGWLTLYAGMAGGGDVILLPEIPYQEKSILKYIEKRNKKEKPYSIVVVAEGIEKPEGVSAAQYISKIIREGTGLESRETILGYIQRGGSPSPMDRVLATSYGSHAVELAVQGIFGVMVSRHGSKIGATPLEEVAGRLKTVPVDHSLILQGRRMGVSFGDE
jgi:6-phosphofructokinase 1